MMQLANRCSGDHGGAQGSEESTDRLDTVVVGRRSATLIGPLSVSTRTSRPRSAARCGTGRVTSIVTPPASFGRASGDPAPPHLPHPADKRDDRQPDRARLRRPRQTSSRVGRAPEGMSKTHDRRLPPIWLPISPLPPRVPRGATRGSGRMGVGGRLSGPSRLGPLRPGLFPFPHERILGSLPADSESVEQSPSFVVGLAASAIVGHTVFRFVQFAVTNVRMIGRKIR
jgi:hypothetical protein